MKSKIVQQIQQIGKIAGVLLMTTLVLGGCSLWPFKNEAAKVEDYNNKIVAMQKEVLQKAQDKATDLTKNLTDREKVGGYLYDMLFAVRQYRDDFKKVTVPPGAEKLAQAMENFYNVELSGLTGVVDAFNRSPVTLKGKALLSHCAAALNNYKIQERNALQNVLNVQKEVAGSYNVAIKSIED